MADFAPGAKPTMCILADLSRGGNRLLYAVAITEEYTLDTCTVYAAHCVKT